MIFLVLYITFQPFRWPGQARAAHLNRRGAGRAASSLGESHQSKRFRSPFTFTGAGRDKLDCSHHFAMLRSLRPRLPPLASNTSPCGWQHAPPTAPRSKRHRATMQQRRLPPPRGGSCAWARIRLSVSAPCRLHGRRCPGPVPARPSRLPSRIASVLYGRRSSPSEVLLAWPAP